MHQAGVGISSGQALFCQSSGATGEDFYAKAFDLLAIARRAHHHIRLGSSFHSDLLWWAAFLGLWNGVASVNAHPIVGRIRVWTDASGSFGCGAVNPTSWEWLQLPWSAVHGVALHELRGDSITLKEVIPIVLACALWGRQWRGQSITIYCDNTEAVSVVNFGYSRAPRIMQLLRCLFFIRAF